MTKSQTNVAAVAGLVVGIAADQLIDPHHGMIGHIVVLLATGGVAVFALERYFRRKKAQSQKATFPPVT
jgi:uncharacterized membrane-anchored protein